MYKDLCHSLYAGKLRGTYLMRLEYLILGIRTVGKDLPCRGTDMRVLLGTGQLAVLAEQKDKGFFACAKG